MPFTLMRKDMTTITISLSDDRLKILEKKSARLHLSPEELVRLSIEELISRPSEDFQQAMQETLKKNAELYKRLAA